MRGVVLNELEILNKALNENIIDKKSPFVTLRILAKHYLGQGLDKDDVIYKLNDFMTLNYDGYRQNKWLDKIKGLVSTVSKYNSFELIDVKEVNITEEEWDIIITLEDKQLQKLAFILLVYQKINAIKNPSSNGWINQTITDIFKEANIGVNGDEQKILLHKLYKKQHIKQKTTCDSTSIQINYVYSDSENKININNFNNVITYYHEFKSGNKYIECRECHKRIRQESNKQTYCKPCGKNMEKRRKLDNWNKNKDKYR